MGVKRITIIGGGISGLSVLHFLKQRHGPAVDVKLYERDTCCGGTIRSIDKASALIEWGPNGFLDHEPTTFQLINELGLQGQLIASKESANLRFIQINGQLEALPTNPIEFITNSLLPLRDKWSLITGLFKKNISQNMSIYEYIAKRFSVNIADTLIDPFIAGIYAGDIKRLHMSAAFPKFKRPGGKKPTLRSFKSGMSTMIEALSKRYHDQIILNSDISSLPESDITILAIPAYAAAKLVDGTNPFLGRILDEIHYAPLAVAGLLFNEESFKRKPQGFGYLIPSREKKEVLGVLIESNIFENRVGARQILLRVMLGGAHHPSMINDSPEQILSNAIKEIDDTYGLVSNPIETFVKLWPKAIPQYELNYPHWLKDIALQCNKTPGLYLCANYIDGISFNDCIKNAKFLADSIKI